ncbi:hypothetical protein B1774_04585 [Dehalococcoides mccartyi]|uniref:ABC-three component system protein n=1 Tax=Dehalococcoides mccartyi TaxID=61435 RepID=UPI00098F23F2|nr:ABC-three component system protein [Dehalococcoides mccartyi]AQU03377.1 hypothetical protein B1773_04940 [Dehalococcoides mccartyi]AQU04674.1 hypothetical protein B1774_04585 [Dehalococcoides mccartyi]
MIFTEFAQMLYPFCGNGKYQSDLVVALVGNIIEDTDDEICPLLDNKPDYLTRIYNGAKPFPRKDAAFVVGHLDKVKFENYISGLSDDAIEGLRTALSEKGFVVAKKYAVASKCADIFAEIMTDCASSTRQRPINRAKIADPFEALKSAEALLAMIPAPTQVEPPEQPLLEEQPYISELYAAYGDKEGVADFSEEHLPHYCEYCEDIKERRIDYFAAESIRRGVSELYSGEYASQFDVLKDETFDGVKNTARKTFPNGYECMLGVMEQAVLIQVKKYILSQSPNWISNKIKMGICHFLVNDNKLRWVKK